MLHAPPISFALIWHLQHLTIHFPSASCALIPMCMFLVNVRQPVSHPYNRQNYNILSSLSFWCMGLVHSEYVEATTYWAGQEIFHLPSSYSSVTGPYTAPDESNPTSLESSSRWPYSPGWVLASSTMCLQASRFLALSFHSVKPIFLRSMDTSSSHLIFGLPLRLVALP